MDRRAAEVAVQRSSHGEYRPHGLATMSAAPAWRRASNTRQAWATNGTRRSASPFPGCPFQVWHRPRSPVRARFRLVRHDLTLQGQHHSVRPFATFDPTKVGAPPPVTVERRQAGGSHTPISLVRTTLAVPRSSASSRRTPTARHHVAGRHHQVLVVAPFDDTGRGKAVPSRSAAAWQSSPTTVPCRSSRRPTPGIHTAATSRPNQQRLAVLMAPHPRQACLPCAKVYVLLHDRRQARRRTYLPAVGTGDAGDSTTPAGRR